MQLQMVNTHLWGTRSNGVAKLTNIGQINMAYDTAAVAVHMASCNWQLIVSLYTLQMLTVTSELVSSKQQTTY